MISYNVNSRYGMGGTVSRIYMYRSVVASKTDCVTVTNISRFIAVYSVLYRMAVSPSVYILFHKPLLLNILYLLSDTLSLIHIPLFFHFI